MQGTEKLYTHTHAHKNHLEEVCSLVGKSSSVSIK